MAFSHFMVLACLLVASQSAYIAIKNFAATQDYYLTFTLHNIDASACNDKVSKVKIWQNGAWRSHNQYYYESAIKADRYAFNYQNVKFGDMLPISIRITMSSGRNIDFWGIMTDLSSGSEFTTDELICDGTLPPTPPTPAPTTRAPTAPTTPYPTADALCIDGDALDWRSKNNEIQLNGNRFNMKGLSWFGYETGNYGLYGLDKHDEDWYFQWMRDRGFNAMRLPFSADFMDSSSSNRQRYKATVQKAGEYGIFVMVDMHSKTAGAWTDGLYTISQSAAISTWSTVAELLKDEYNVFMADVFNEPHDVSNAQWGEWLAFCEDVAEAIWAKGADWLIAVEGTNWQCDEIGCSWGENLQGVRMTGKTFNAGNNKFIWSPHVYGADVTGNAYSVSAWQKHWGYLTDGSTPSNQAASVVGEFGTRYTGSMVKWLDDLITYLISIDQRNTFFWCLNPNSGDTGGLLGDDWTTAQDGKLAALDRLQPLPSIVNYNAGSDRVCIQFDGDKNGAFANGGEDEDDDVAISAVEIAAISVIALVVVAAVIVAVICCGRRRKRKEVGFEHEDSASSEKIDEREVDDVEKDGLATDTR